MKIIETVLMIMIIGLCLCDPISVRDEEPVEKNVEIKFHRIEYYPDGTECNWNLWVLVDSKESISNRPDAVHFIGDTSHTYYAVKLTGNSTIYTKYFYAIPNDYTHYKAFDTLTINFQDVEDGDKIWWYLKKIVNQKK